MAAAPAGESACFASSLTAFDDDAPAGPLVCSTSLTAASNCTSSVDALASGGLIWHVFNAFALGGRNSIDESRRTTFELEISSSDHNCTIPIGKMRNRGPKLTMSRMTVITVVSSSLAVLSSQMPRAREEPSERKTITSHMMAMNMSCFAAKGHAATFEAMLAKQTHRPTKSCTRATQRPQVISLAWHICVARQGVLGHHLLS